MTIKEQTLEVLLDLQWHCTVCELAASQAKTYQILRQEGWSFDTTIDGQYCSNIFCRSCGRITTHRRLTHDHKINQSVVRNTLSKSERVRVYNYYDDVEAVYNHQKPRRELEIDHRFPQIRWGEENFLPYENLESNFMLLTRSNNQIKSRACERCVRTGERDAPFGIKFWYEGDRYWRGKDECDYRGCIGCFWFDPNAWRDSLNLACKI